MNASTVSRIGVSALLASMLMGCESLKRSSLAGKYCLKDASSSFTSSCIYLKSDGTGSLTMFNSFGGNISWSFIEDQKISLTGDATGAGMILDVSSDKKALTMFGGMAKYEKTND